MYRSFLIGLVAGMRSMTPMAAVSLATRGGTGTAGARALLAHPAARVATLLLAAGELVGDKLPSAPDRVVAPGMAARIVTGGLAGAALAPRDRRVLAGALGAAGAVAAGYVSLALRRRLIARFGQTASGLAEDAIVLAATIGLVGARG